MRKSLLGMYHNLREAGNESDFPNILGNTMHKVMLKEFNGFASPWRSYCAVSDLADFKSHDRLLMSGAPDLDEIETESDYKEAKFSEDKYSIQAKTFGKVFTVNRKTIINDDLNAMTRIPGAFGRSSVRTMVKRALTMLKGGVNAYDGNPLFALRSGNASINYIPGTALTNTAAGAAAVSECMNLISLATDPDTGELLGLTPKILLTGVTLGTIAKQLIKSATIEPASASGGGNLNAIASLTPVVEPLIDSILGTTWWAVLADPAECPVIEIGFLNGKAEPDLLVQKPTMVSVAGGGEDPYNYSFDELSYKVRHDCGMQLGMYQGIVRGKS